MKPVILAANWKMNLGVEESRSLASQFAALAHNATRTEVWIAPSFVAIPACSATLSGSSLRLGAQNVHWEPKGAFTGEVSPSMLTSLGCSFSIIGHSERRHILGESDSIIARRARGALEGGLIPVFCIGETLAEREQGLTDQVLRIQLDALFEEIRPLPASKIIIAYEPVWAIGTGKVASTQNIVDAHHFIFNHFSSSLKREPDAILYGGSVTGDNFGEIIALPHVDGGLVGGASLSVEKFGPLFAISESR